MNCNLEIHGEFITVGEIVCPFCEERLAEVDKTIKATELCCDNKELINDNGMIVCQNCGVVDSYDLVPGYIDFYENMYNIRRKSVYDRKYHVENALNSICYDQRVRIDS